MSLLSCRDQIDSRDNALRSPFFLSLSLFLRGSCAYKSALSRAERPVKCINDNARVVIELECDSRHRCRNRLVVVVATARNYLPRQRYRLSRQIARRVSRHFVVPLLSFLIRRRDKRSRAGPGRAVPDGLTIASRRDRFSHRATAPGEILFLGWCCVVGERETRGSIRPPICRRSRNGTLAVREARRNFPLAI